MTAREVLAFVREHGVVLVSAKGPVPKLVDAIAGEPVKGSWWGHPQSHRIYAVLQVVEDSDDVFVCRLVDGKITLVHRRLWPALAAVADRFAAERVAKVVEEHTASGRHVTHYVAFSDWVPDDVKAAAAKLTQDEALRALGPWTESSATRGSK